MTSLPVLSFSAGDDRRPGDVVGGEPAPANGSGPIAKWLGSLTAVLAERSARAGCEPAVATAGETHLRVRLEECLRENAALREELERRGRMEAELRRAKETAETASRVKGGFLAAIGHEIRTPMNGVIGLANLLLESPLNAEQRELAQTVCRSGEGLIALLNDLLDYSKGEAGGLRLERIEFDLLEQLQMAVALHAEAAARKGLEVVLDLEPAVPAYVCGDPLRLRQVILNLLSNAIKFTARGEVLVRVRCDSATAERTRLRFEVVDTGIGIAAPVQATLFQPFVQAEAATARKYGGTGLGLAICRQLVELMGGEIGVRSTEGTGSAFWFTVGLELAPPAGPGRPVALRAIEGRRTLIVGADAATRIQLDQLCTAWRMPHGVAASATAAEAHLSWAAQTGRPFELVVLDRRLADGDGLDLAKSILEDPLIPRPALVLLTAHDERVPRAQWEAQGIAAAELKPVYPEKLRDTLGRVLAPTAAGGAR